MRSTTKLKPVVALFLSANVLTGTADAAITLLGEDGSIFNLNTSTGVAALAVKYGDPGVSPPPTEERFSPNALGVSGTSYFYTTFNASGGNETVFKDGSSILSVATADNAIAAGDAIGNKFYYVDRDGDFVTVSNIFGSATANDPNGQNIGTGSSTFTGATLGDLAISGTTGYLSYGSSLSKFDITNPGAGFMLTMAQSRFVGLGFDGDSLYGVLKVGDNNFDLYTINTTTLTAVFAKDITGIPTTGGAVSGTYEITDASRSVVPLPAAAWLLLSGLGGLGLLGRRRKAA